MTHAIKYVKRQQTPQKRVSLNGLWSVCEEEGEKVPTVQHRRSRAGRGRTLSLLLCHFQRKIINFQTLNGELCV
jgi:hypothetical protein